MLVITLGYPVLLAIEGSSLTQGVLKFFRRKLKNSIKIALIVKVELTSHYWCTRYGLYASIKHILQLFESLDNIILSHDEAVWFIVEFSVVDKNAILILFWMFLLFWGKDFCKDFFKPAHNKVQSWTQHTDTQNANHLFCCTDRHVMQWIITIPEIIFFKKILK